MGSIGFGSTNAVAGFDKMALPKAKMELLLAANAKAILDAVVAGKDADDDALDLTAYAIDVANGMSASSDSVYSGRDDLVSMTDAMGPALGGAPTSPRVSTFSTCSSLLLACSSLLLAAPSNFLSVSDLPFFPFSRFRFFSSSHPSISKGSLRRSRESQRPRSRKAS